jgi:(hydroxyamino)benzene mutase
MNKNIIRHGFVLILLALVSGLFVPAMPIPRLGLSAHTIGILSGALLIGVGAVWPLFTLTVRQQQVMYWSWLYSSYVNWLGCLVGAIFGAGNTTPVASAGAVGSDAAEAAVAIMLVSVGVVSFVAVGLAIFGLRAGANSAA